MAIDTGDGGFVIDGQTYVMDTGLPESEGGAQGVPNKKVSVDVGGKDITNATKRAIVGNASDSTQQNAYPVDSGVVDYAITDDKGNPAPITQHTNSSEFARNLPRTQSEAYTVVSSNIKKGKQSKQGVDGNSLLGSPVAKTYVSAVLANNRFSSLSQATVQDPSSPPGDYDPALANQHSLGTYNAKGQGVTTGRLAQVGPTLLMRAGLEAGSTDSGFNPNSAASQSAAILPGAAQLAAQRVNKALLTAKDVLDTLTNEEVPESSVISPNSLSWGNLNNTEDPYSGTNALGMAATSIALVSALLIAVDGLSFLIGLVSPHVKQATHDSQGRYTLGAYYGGGKKNGGGLLGAVTSVASLDIGSLIGIQPTVNPFDVALKKGARAFFGVDNGGGLLSSLISNVTRSSGLDAGFNAVVARSIIRSTITVKTQLNKISGNPINAAKQALALVDVLRGSKLISACNVFAQLGDALLSTPEGWIDTDADGSVKISEIDKGNVGANAASQSRLPGTLKLAWANNMAHTQLLVPSQITMAALASRNMGAFDPRVSSDLDSNATMTSLVGENGRISPDDVEFFEKQLDSEYVPFYFHDLRTNELVGFHAFLASMSDSFNVAHETTDAYGRVEPVSVYKNTQRKISFSFYVVSTSLPDFDAMWVKINKLITLVYPQYTAGKQVQNNDGSYVFTQPFSQLIGASPVVRIRMGDLMRSNYSKFALARLFGLGNENFKVNNKSFTSVSDLTDADQDGVTTQLQTYFNDPQGETWVPDGQAFTYVENNGISISISVPNPFGGSTGSGTQAPTFKQKGSGDFFMIKAVKVLSNNTIVGEVQINEDYVAWEGVTGGKNAVQKAYSDPDDVPNNFIGGRYVFSTNQLRPTQATLKKAQDKVLGDKLGSDEFAPALEEFMADTGNSPNALAFSFRQTGGKGLAGKIDGLEFDWMVGTCPWETQLDRRAPKACKVTVQFTPIHDISPGIDHMGYNRSPVFPIGRLAPIVKPTSS